MGFRIVVEACKRASGGDRYIKTISISIYQKHSGVTTYSHDKTFLF